MEKGNLRDKLALFAEHWKPKIVSVSGSDFPSASEDHPMQAISPVEALQRLNEAVTVEMFIKRTKSCTCSSQFFLDCEENKRDPNNLGLVVTTAGAARFKEAGIADPAEHFQGKTIRVQGTVILKEGRPYIEVDDPGQIEVVE